MKIKILYNSNNSSLVMQIRKLAGLHKKRINKTILSRISNKIKILEMV